MGKTHILGIETSCDETAAAVVANGNDVLANIVASQVDWHRRFGGVVPEIAARHHLELVNDIVDQALAKANISFTNLSAIAVTHGPGLVGALLVGMTTAKSYSYALSIPLIGVNHLEGHVYAVMLDNPELRPPFIALVISGGHTNLVEIEGFGKYITHGRTIDDAAGEAFDKIAKFLGLGYPGGPIIDELAKKGDPSAYDFPRAMLHSGDYNFSLSGLKTAVINLVNNMKKRGEEFSAQDVCASFQRALLDVQVRKTIKLAKETGISSIALTGGVAANSELRSLLTEASDKLGINFFAPSAAMCTDNAAMIAAAAYHHFLKKEYLPLDADVDANLKL